MTKFEELYNKYLQILKIEDEDDQDEALNNLDEELYLFVCNKYPELKDFLDSFDFIELIDTYSKEKSFIRRIIEEWMENDHIIFYLLNINENKVIEEYINKNINNHENN